MAGRHRDPTNTRATRRRYLVRRSPKAYVAMALAATTGVGLLAVPASAETTGRLLRVEADPAPRLFPLRPTAPASRAERPAPPAAEIATSRASATQRAREAELARQEAEKAAHRAAEVRAQQATRLPASAAEVAVRTALAQRGKPYVWGAVGPGSFDCSGLVLYAYRAAGVALPRVASAQARAGVAVSRADLRPGDLVAYYAPVSHIAIYVGDGLVVQAPNAGDVVRVTPIDWAGTPAAYRRVA